ncbi:acyl-CoA carboxylase epsilon subunit [Streptomyces roseoverticillatus]|uniref:Acyl-CoA carboxylase epsilon subunit n=1 Tax=Streptomyces roseoverticillatus TaxID=66429 RepID=A0ABV3J4S5_9ACTN
MTTELFLRVEKGEAGPEELAALTAVLLARTAAGPGDPARRDRATARWARPERTPRSPGPRSWRGTPPSGR